MYLTYNLLNTYENRVFLLVARERFELSSEAPEAPMLDHYTTGLPLYHKTCFHVITLTLLQSAFFFFERFPNTVAFLADRIPVAATP